MNRICMALVAVTGALAGLAGSGTSNAIALDARTRTFADDGAESFLSRFLTWDDSACLPKFSSRPPSGFFVIFR